MKKFFKFFAIALTFLTFICSFACSSGAVLSFNSAFTGSATGAITAGYTETCEYSVVFIKDESFISSTIDDVDFTDGSFKTELSVLGVYPENLPDTDLYDRNAQNLATVIEFKTTFTVTAKYVVGGNEKAFNDSVETVAYFLSDKNSYAPLYSKTKTVSGNPLKEENVSETEEFSILYKSSSYEITTDKTATVNYVPKTVIDNAQTLFVIRNFSLTDTGTNIPVVAKAYGKHVSVSFVLSSAENKDYTVDFGDGEQKYKFGVNYGYFNVNNTNESGTSQKFAIQKQGGEGTFKSLLTYYQMPVTVNAGDFYPTCFGTIDFTIKSVSVNGN